MNGGNRRLSSRLTVKNDVSLCMMLESCIPLCKATLRRLSHAQHGARLRGFGCKLIAQASGFRISLAMVLSSRRCTMS